MIDHQKLPILRTASDRLKIFCYLHFFYRTVSHLFGLIRKICPIFDFHCIVEMNNASTQPPSQWKDFTIVTESNEETKIFWFPLFVALFFYVIFVKSQVSFTISDYIILFFFEVWVLIRSFKSWTKNIYFGIVSRSENEVNRLSNFRWICTCGSDGRMSDNWG